MQEAHLKTTLIYAKVAVKAGSIFLDTQNGMDTKSKQDMFVKHYIPPFEYFFHTYIHIYMYMYANIHKCMRVCIHTHIYIHTYVHT